MNRLMLLFVLWGILGEPASSSASDLNTMKLVKCTYTLGSNEVLSSAVNKLVSSSKHFPLRTWGQSGWLDVTEKLNGPNFEGNIQLSGNKFDILIPENHVKDHKKQLENCSEVYFLVRASEKPSTDNISQLTADAQMAKELKESDLVADYEELQEIMPVIKKPKGWYFLMRFKVMIKEVSPIVDTPVKEPGPVVPEIPTIKEPDLPPILTEDLTDEKIAALTTEEADSIAPEVIEEKAAEASFFDSLKPGMNTLFKGLDRKTAAGIVALRLGYPLVVEKSLASKIKTLGLLVELRGDLLKGLRYGYDYSPKAKITVEGIDESFSYTRHSLGWAFEIPVNWFINQIHIIPRLGTYTIESELGTKLKNGSLETRNFKIKNGLALGWEFDVEKAAYFSILRAWVAQDVSGKVIGIDRSESVTSLKIGFDASIKGGPFSLAGSRVSTNYLVFLANERIRLEGVNEQSGEFDIAVEIPIAGIGFGLSW